MILINRDGLFVATADQENKTHWYVSDRDTYYQKTNIGVSLTEVPLPDAEWAVPYKAQLVDGVWQEYIPEEVITND